MIKTFEFIKIIYVFIFIFNIVCLGLLLDFSSFIETMLGANTAIIIGYYIKEASENMASAYVTAKYRRK